VSAPTEPAKSDGASTPESTRLFDIAGMVTYLHSIGAMSATPNFARGLITSGAIPHIRIGRKFFVTREALDVWIERHQRRPR